MKTKMKKEKKRKKKMATMTEEHSCKHNSQQAQVLAQVLLEDT